MSNIAKFLNESINQRSQIWREYERAVATDRELTSRFSQDFDSTDTVNTINPLTGQNLPQSEMLAVITNLEQLQLQITQVQSKIRSDENEVAVLKTKAKNLIIILSAISIFLLGGLAVYVKNQTQNNKNSTIPTIIFSSVTTY